MIASTSPGVGRLKLWTSSKFSTVLMKNGLRLILFKFTKCSWNMEFLKENYSKSNSYSQSISLHASSIVRPIAKDSAITGSDLQYLVLFSSSASSSGAK